MCSILLVPPGIHSRGTDIRQHFMANVLSIRGHLVATLTARSIMFNCRWSSSEAIRYHWFGSLCLDEKVQLKNPTERAIGPLHPFQYIHYGAMAMLELSTTNYALQDLRGIHGWSGYATTYELIGLCQNSLSYDRMQVCSLCFICFCWPSYSHAFLSTFWSFSSRGFSNL